MTAQLVVATLVVLGVLGGVAALAAGYGDALAPAWRDAAPLPLPTGRLLTADDLAAARFGVSFRGYRMAEVDLVLSRLADELAERDDELARLRGPVGAAGPVGADEVPGGEATGEAPVAGEAPDAGETGASPAGAPVSRDALPSEGHRGG